MNFDGVGAGEVSLKSISFEGVSRLRYLNGHVFSD
jgi:hypothetical protein